VMLEKGEWVGAELLLVCLGNAMRRAGRSASRARMSTRRLQPPTAGVQEYSPDLVVGYGVDPGFESQAAIRRLPRLAHFGTEPMTLKRLVAAPRRDYACSVPDCICSDLVKR